MKITIIILALLILIIITAMLMTVQRADLNETHLLHIGETLNLPENGVQLTVTKLLADSRCPSDVQCEWAGWVAIEVELNNNQEKHTLQIGHTDTSVQIKSFNPNSPQFEEGATAFGDYFISFDRVWPVRGKQADRIPLSDYQFGISIIKKNSNTKTVKAGYGKKTVYAENTTLAFPDFTLQYIGETNVQGPNNAPWNITTYHFLVTKNNVSKKIYWSSGTGVVGPYPFTLNNTTYWLEKAFSKTAGNMENNELVITQHD